MEKDFGMCSDCDFLGKRGICINIDSKHHGEKVSGKGGCDKIQSHYLQHAQKAKEGGDTRVR